MKKIRHYIVLILVLALTTQNQIMAYANEWQGIQAVKSRNTYGNNHVAGAVAAPRGRLISSIEIQIADKGNGTVGVYADLLCHEPMKKLKIWLYLEQWDQEKETWVVVDTQQFEWSAENNGGEDLTMAMVSYNVPKQERGKDYQLRGLFGANGFEAGTQESWQAYSGEIMLE